MSSNAPKNSPWHEWEGQLPPKDLEHIRAIAKHALDPILQTSITDRGTVRITVHQALRNGNLRIPRSFEHTLQGQNQPFKHYFLGRKGSERQALTFWLKPEAMQGNIQRKLDDFAAALATKHGIGPLEVRYYVPSDEIKARFGQAVGCGVVLATIPEHARDMASVKSSIEKERVAAEVLVPPTPKIPTRKILNLPTPALPFSWEKRFSTRGARHQRAQLARVEVLEHTQQRIPIMPVKIHDNGTATFNLSDIQAEILGEPTQPLNLTVSDEDLIHHSASRNTEGIAVWLKPSFFNLSEHNLLQWRETIRPKVNALIRRLEAKHGIPIYPALIPMEDKLEHTGGMVGSALIFMSTPEHKQVLLNAVRDDIITSSYLHFKRPPKTDELDRSYAYSVASQTR